MLAGGALLLTGCTAPDQSPVVSAAPSTEAPAPALSPEPLAHHVTLNIIEFGIGRVNPTLTERTQEAIKLANKTILFATDGAYSVKAGTVEQALALPSGRDKNGPCYTADQLFSLADRRVHARSADQLTAVVGDKARTCDDPKRNLKAFAGISYGDSHIIALTEPAASVFDHEITHQWGVGHYPKIACPRNFELDPTVDPALVDIESTVENCGAIKNSRGETDEYASNLSTMGSQKLSSDPGFASIVPVYANNDLQRLLPDRFTNKSVPAAEGSYELEYQKGHANSVSIAIDDSHPLRKVDSQISRITFALEVTGGGTVTAPSCVEEQCYLSITAETPSLRYEISEPYSADLTTYGLPEYDFKDGYNPILEKGGDYNIWYIDKTLNIIVMSPLNVDKGRMTIQIVPYDTNRELIWDKAQAYKHKMQHVLAEMK